MRVKEEKISRRDFMKLALTSIGTFLVSCGPRATETREPTVVPTSTETSTPEMKAADTPTSTVTATDTPAPTEMGASV
jgi:hypothetical protein